MVVIVIRKQQKEKKECSSSSSAAAAQRWSFPFSFFTTPAKQQMHGIIENIFIFIFMDFKVECFITIAWHVCGGSRPTDTQCDNLILNFNKIHSHIIFFWALWAYLSFCSVSFASIHTFTLKYSKFVNSSAFEADSFIWLIVDRQWHQCRQFGQPEKYYAALNAEWVS